MAMPMVPVDVRQVVASALRLPIDALDPDSPLTGHGADSLSSMEIVAALEDATGERLPEWLLAECPTVRSIEALLSATPSRRARAREPWRHDLALADGIQPPPGDPCFPAARVLLTGATGFLGAAVLDRLMRHTAADIVCVVRACNETVAHTRVLEALERYGLQPPESSRLEVLSGDVAAARLGLAGEDWDRCASGVDAVVHAAADLNWVSPYESLRAANVLGTLELLRLAAAGRPKRFHFVSSVSVCYPTGGPRTLDERADPRPTIASLPLGYAQSKAVAEHLVKTAAANGLAATISRPALLAGHSSSGASNPGDLVAALIKGCITMRAAPDLDWVFDLVPVDVAADAIVKVVMGREEGDGMLHLLHPRPRHWRECVLWLNLLGYRVPLEPFARWQSRLQRESRAVDHPLHGLRAFFLRPVSQGRTTAELYEAGVRTQVGSARSLRRVTDLGVAYPPLDGPLLDRCVSDLVRRRFLPAPSRGPSATQPIASAGWSDPACLAAAVRNAIGSDVAAAGVSHISRRDAEHSIIGELTAWRHGNDAGLFDAVLSWTSGREGGDQPVVIKVKAPGSTVLEVARTTARVCDRALGQAVERFERHLGLEHGAAREVAIYGLDSPGLRAHRPRCLARWADEERESFGLVLERLDGLEVSDVTSASDWTGDRLAAALDGLAAIHADWLDRTSLLAGEPWMERRPCVSQAAAMSPLWRALADHARPIVRRSGGAALGRIHSELADSVSAWWPTLEAIPSTLIHNDCNPRNLGLRRTPDGLRLVAFDWELATIGPPARDLAEWLCFTLRADVDVAEVARWQRHYLDALRRASGLAMKDDEWDRAFRASLAELLVSRLSFYAMVDRIRPQPFLPRVLETWLALWTIASRRTEGRW
jgi:thioester reductase-like protein